MSRFQSSAQEIQETQTVSILQGGNQMKDKWPIEKILVTFVTAFILLFLVCIGGILLELFKI